MDRETRIFDRIAREVGVSRAQIVAAAGLMDEGATVPFIARYRKEVTGGMDDGALRLLEERLPYWRELEDRRETILSAIDAQGKLTDELRAQIVAAETKQTLEDLYLPYKPVRRTRAAIAREAGLEPLALALMADHSLDPEALAPDYLNPEKGVDDVKKVLDGARYIVADVMSMDAELLKSLRQFVWKRGEVKSTLEEGKADEGAKFQDYFDFAEPIHAIPSHRAMALFRGREEGILRLELLVDEDAEGTPMQGLIAEHFEIGNATTGADRWLRQCVRWLWRVKLSTSIETELYTSLRERSEEEAINVFGSNLRDLLLASPAGQKVVMGLDPGIRTGCKVAVIDQTGALKDKSIAFIVGSQAQSARAEAELVNLIRKHGVELIAIGNGTASRETDAFVIKLLRDNGLNGVRKMVVSEAGASVYSASELAAREFPDLDVSYRGAVSIARRLQDPLAELVKIDPKAIGVGQYQHDVDQRHLAQKLQTVVEDCVNAVGVDVNTASESLLAYVAGLSPARARALVEFRNQHGLFASRKALMAVPGIGRKTFEQAVGFLRITGGENPLDASGVHPEAYSVVEHILEKTGMDVKSLIGNVTLLKTLRPSDFANDTFGVPTVKDILSELEKPGRDPRPEFKTATFAEGVNDVEDLRPGMILEGVVSNVAAFGAFVDIGVHQDGLVHISELSNTFVSDPKTIVKVGDIVKVRVLDVDVRRRRISLSRNLQAKTDGERPARRSNDGQRARTRESQPTGAMANAFANLKRR